MHRNSWRRVDFRITWEPAVANVRCIHSRFLALAVPPTFPLLVAPNRNDILVIVAAMVQRFPRYFVAAASLLVIGV